MSTKIRHFVTFYSPGTFMSESTTKDIPELHPPLAARMAREIEERYEAKPYGFRFETRITHDPIPDGAGGTLNVESKTTAKTGTYFLTGTVRAYSEISEAKDTNILRSNMRGNDWPLMIENTNSYRTIMPYEAGDCIVDANGNIIDRGDSAAREAQRARERAAWATSAA
jgi:hypothetical protein